MNNTAVIILAAGKSTRMKSSLPKVIHPVCARPMIGYVLDLVRDLKIKNTVAVLGYKSEEVKKFLPAGVKVAIQRKLDGTGSAVREGLKKLGSFKGTVLILYGDTPLLKKDTVLKLLKFHNENKLDATLLTSQLEKPDAYGRILRDKFSAVKGVIEDKDADEVDKEIKEINTGIICFNAKALRDGLKGLKPENAKKEYYLTDIIKIFYQEGRLTDAVKTKDVLECMGINTRKDLSLANKIMQERINEKFMLQGVSIVDPGSTFISFGTKIGQDSVIYPFTVIERDVKIGNRCQVGPFAHLRDGSRLEDDVVAGNFLEIVRSKISASTLVKHFSYIGDAQIGKKVNIGAGTVVANFNGRKKNNTVIKDGAFIGSDTVLVAPVRIGRNAATGAGSVVCKNRNVADNTVVAGVPAKRIKNK